MLRPLAEEELDDSEVVIACLRTSTHKCFSSVVSARSGYVRVVALKIKAFSPPPKSSGAVSSTENPSLDEPMTTSPRGNASWGEGRGKKVKGCFVL